MLPTINGKFLYDCTLEEFKEILGSSDFRENEYLDYKQSFSVLDYPKEKKKERQIAISEFRSDVCAFANANGGYLVYGVKEDGQGVPSELTGISIDNTDKFELNIKTWLGPINPRVPNCKVKFFNLDDDKYVVLIFVRHDSFAPYVHLENERDYRIYKRVGNGKTAMSYSEMKSMFTQSIVFEKEVERFRNERIDYYHSQAETADDIYTRFMLLHIIPETSIDSNYNQPLFVLERNGHKFDQIFSSFDCISTSVPMVEGLRFINYQNESEGRLYNNGIAELWFSLKEHLSVRQGNPNGFFPWVWAWNKIVQAVDEYIRSLHSIFVADRLYICFSLIGCKNVQTDDNYMFDPSGKIDRDKLTLNIAVIDNSSDTGSINHGMLQMKLDYMLSLGVKSRKYVDEVIAKLYGKQEESFSS